MAMPVEPVEPVERWSPMAALQEAVARVALSTVPADPEVALAEADVLLAMEQQLKVLAMRRIADVEARGLHEREGFTDVRAWLRDRRPDGDTTDATLASALRDFPVLSAKVESGECSMASARKVVHALRQCRKHVDTGDGLIDGYPAGPVIAAVVGNVVTLVTRYLHGLEDDDPRLAELCARTRTILEEGGSELRQLERAFTLLAEQVPLPALTGLCDELLVSLVPSLLEQRGEAALDSCGLVMHRKPGGAGWKLDGDLDVECGERLFAVLRSEAARDPRNPVDTELWVHCRDNGIEPWDQGAELLRPRDRRRRLHDALNRMLERYLEAGLGGAIGKVPVQLHVVIPDAVVADAGGALPARGESGTLIPRALVKRWWCDSQVTAFVLSLGGKALRAVHAQRTLTALERKALRIETGGVCAGLGCCREGPDPHRRVTPHHVRAYSRHRKTSLGETIHLCDRTHADVHAGKVVLLRDGRYLSEHGITDELPQAEPPPF